MLTSDNQKSYIAIRQGKFKKPVCARNHLHKTANGICLGSLIYFGLVFEYCKSTYFRQAFNFRDFHKPDIIAKI